MMKSGTQNAGDLAFLESHKMAKLSSLKTTASSSSLTKSKIKLPGIYHFLVLR